MSSYNSQTRCSFSADPVSQYVKWAATREKPFLLTRATQSEVIRQPPVRGGRRERETQTSPTQIQNERRLKASWCERARKRKSSFWCFSLLPYMGLQFQIDTYAPWTKSCVNRTSNVSHACKITGILVWREGKHVLALCSHEDNMKSESSSRWSGSREGGRGADAAAAWHLMREYGIGLCSGKSPVASRRHWRRCHLGRPQKRPRYYHTPVRRG